MRLFSSRLTDGASPWSHRIVSTYPLDLVRSRISIASASLYSEAKKAATPTTSGVSSGASNPTAVPNSSPAATVGPSSSVTLAQAVTTTADESAPAPSNAALRREIAARQSKMPGIVEMTVKVYREEGGIRGLYRGCVPTSMVSAHEFPYVTRLSRRPSHVDLFSIDHRESRPTSPSTLPPTKRSGNNSLRQMRTRLAR